MDNNKKAPAISNIILSVLVLGIVGIGGYYFGFLKNKPQEEVISSSIASSAPSVESKSIVTSSIVELSLYEQYKVFTTIKPEMTDEEILEEIERIYNLPENVVLDPETLRPIEETTPAASSSSETSPTSSKPTTTNNGGGNGGGNGGRLPPGFDSAIDGGEGGGEEGSPDMGGGEKIGY